MGDAEHAGILKHRFLWIGVGVLAIGFAWNYYSSNAVYFWASLIVAAFGGLLGLMGHRKLVVDTGKREIRASETYLWGKATARNRL